jgi:hypothetical protein
LKLYLYSPNTPPWRGVQLKHRDNFTFYLYLYRYITVDFTFNTFMMDSLAGRTVETFRQIILLSMSVIYIASNILLLW